MELKELKQKLKTNNLDFGMSLIFVSESFYLPLSYISYLKESLNYNINYIEEIIIRDSLLFDSTSEDKNVDIFIADKIDNLENIPKNTIIITKKLSDAVKEKFKDKIVEFPKLENWQIEDFSKVIGKGVSETNLKWLLDITNYDIYRITSELSKLQAFPEKSRNNIFEALKEENNFEDLTPFNIFSLSNGLINRNKADVLDVLKDIDHIDINAIGLVTVLYNNFKNIVSIQLGINPTPESLGITPKQFTALRFRVNKYKAEELVKIMELLTAIDYKLKAGTLPADMIIPYIILKIINVKA